MRSHDTHRRTAQPSAVHLFCALVLGLTGCAGGAPATNAAGQAIVGGVPGAPTVLSPNASPFADPGRHPALDVDHSGIAGLEPADAPRLELAPDVVLATRGDLGELGELSRLNGAPAATPTPPPATPPTEEAPADPPATPPNAPVFNHAEATYTERYDALDIGMARVELLEGAARCAPVVSNDACSLVACETGTLTRRVFVPFAAMAVGDEVVELLADDEESPVYMAEFGIDDTESVALSAYVEGVETGPVFVTDLAATGRPAFLETLTVGTTQLQPGSDVTVSAPDDLSLGWEGYSEPGTLRVILAAGEDRNQYVECTFDPQEGRGSVPATLLNQLGAPDLSVEVASVDEKVNVLDSAGAVWTVVSRNERVLLDQMSVYRR